MSSSTYSTDPLLKFSISREVRPDWQGCQHPSSLELSRCQTADSKSSTTALKAFHMRDESGVGWLQGYMVTSTPEASVNQQNPGPRIQSKYYHFEGDSVAQLRESRKGKTIFVTVPAFLQFSVYSAHQ